MKEYHHYLGFDHSKDLNTEDIKGRIAQDNLKYLFEDGVIVFQQNWLRQGEDIIWVEMEK